MIALDIKVKNEYNSYLKMILNDVNYIDYSWEIVYEDFVIPENNDKNFFESKIMDGINFYKSIIRNSYYMIFVDIKAYPIGYKKKKINTFVDFMNSSCELILLCTDSTNIEFYCKNNTILDIVYHNCISEDFIKVEYKSIEDVYNRKLVAW